MKWAIPKKQSRMGYEGVPASHPRDNDKDPAFRGFNLPLGEPYVGCDTIVSETRRATYYDTIAPSNDELRRSLPQFAPPSEWFDDNLEEQVW